VTLRKRPGASGGSGDTAQVQRSPQACEGSQRGLSTGHTVGSGLASSPLPSDAVGFISKTPVSAFERVLIFLCVVLGFELRAYTLSYSTSPFLGYF
jgi:hypothetical protein